MRAAYYDRQGKAGDVLMVGEAPIPTPARGEVLVQIHVSGLNPSDIKARTGFSAGMHFERIIPHQDGAGVIKAVGDGVPDRRIGERVWVYEAQAGRPFGTAADYVTVPADRAVVLPDTTSFAVGAALGIPALTAHRCLFADGDIHGRRVLVHGGAGVVGSAAIMLAKWAGAWVATTVLSAEQQAIAQAAGADLILNLQEQDVPAAIRTATHGAGVDRIVDVDLLANIEIDLACLSITGVISAYAMRDAGDKVSLPLLKAMVGGCVFRFVYIYTVPQTAKEAAIADITAALTDGAYTPLIGLSVPLDLIVDAHLALETRKVAGKILIEIRADNDIPR